LSLVHQVFFRASTVPSSKTKGKAAALTKSATPEKASATDGTVTQMLQGKGFVIEDRKLRDTAGLAPETRATILSKVLDDKIIMCQTCLVKLNSAVCNVEISDEFGQRMTEHGTTNVHLSLLLQLFYDVAHPEPSYHLLCEILMLVPQFVTD
jgi:hypothetical protein